NVTGITPYVDGLPAKQMELARELVPGATKGGLLVNLNDPKALPARQEMVDAGPKVGLSVVVSEVDRPEGIEAALETLARAQVDVVVVLQTSMLLSERQQIAVSVAAKRLPTLYGYREHVDGGGLISYGI